MTMGTANKIAKVIKCVEPDAYGAGAVNGPAIDCRQFGQLLIALMLGTMGTNATIDCKVQESADGSTGWTDVSGAAFTQKNQAVVDDSDKTFQGSVGCQNRQRYMRVVMTVGTAASDVAVDAILLDPQEAPITPTQSDTFTVA